ncbi:hypothetical protein [Methylobacterium sp. ARG-1]|uniref:hypothetical protein n=1 Tax=Methylobacterium sp. ARG-1 TaxID=1692501 RepID=UPI000680EBB7|nr:hypothetical protein [Methylobacterium sp. ARG-1]KNY21602.1 hypothetical protein AKJ13_15220 [Methylobacterium sp. ARG-1]
MALAKPSVGVSATENANRIGAAFDVIDTLGVGLGTLQQQIVDTGNEVNALEARRAAGDAALNARISGLAPIVSGNSQGIVVLQQQIIDAGKATIDIDARLRALTDNVVAPSDTDAAAPADRPGEALAYFTTSLAGGDASKLARPNVVLAASGDNGRVLRMTGSGLVARRRLEPIEDGRTYRPRVAVRRRVNASDPSNDGVRVAIAWYDQNRIPLAGATGTTVLANLTTLTVGIGRRQIGGLVSTSGVAPTVKPPAGARYARLFVQCYGTDHVTDVEVMSWRDVTDASVYSPDLSAFTGDLGALKSAQLPDRVGLLEQNAATPLSTGFVAVLAAKAATVPAAITNLDVLGYSDPGDGAGGRYRRSTYAPTHPWAVQTKDGAWFEIQGRRKLEQIGGKGDGSTDNRPILLKAPAGSMVNIDAPGTYRFAAGLLGGPGTVISAGPGVKFSSQQGIGALNFAPGTRFEAYHEGADGQVRYWGHRPTGKRAVGTGALDAGFSAASWMFDIRTDDSDVGSSFRNGILLRHIITGGSGGVQGLYAATYQNAPTSATSGNRNYTPIQGAHYQQSGDGGYPNSDPNINGGKHIFQGAGFGLGAACYTDDTAQFLLNQTAVELNVFGMPFNGNTAGPTVSIWTNVQAVSARATRGFDVDIAYALGSQGQNQQYGPEVGWKIGWGVTDAFGGIPLAADSTIIGAKWIRRTAPVLVQYGIDWSAFQFSGGVLKTGNLLITEGSIAFGGKQVLAQRQPAIPDPSDAATTTARLVDVLNAMRTHGLIAN